MTGIWTRARLIELAGEHEVSLTDRNAIKLPTPDWMLNGRESAFTSTGQRMAATHPDDRQAVVDKWWEAVRDPGSLFEYTVRAQLDGQWISVHTRQVCLFDQEDIAAMVSVIEFDRVVEGDEFAEVIQSGEYEESRWLIHTLDEAGVILATEGMVHEITGRDPEDVIGQAVIEHLHPDGFDDAITLWMVLQNGPPGTTRTARQRVLRPDGSVIWVESTSIKRVGDDGIPTVMLIAHDVTDRRRQESALRTSQHEFRLLADQVPAAVFRVDSHQVVTFRNEPWRQLFEADGPVERLADVVHPDDRARHDGELQTLATGRTAATVAYEVRSAEGDRVLAISCRSVLDLVNEMRSYVGSLTDITATVRLRERAERDALTGLWNRQSTEELLARALSSEPTGTLVLFVDLDGFKTINDTWGHDIGDHVLREVARRLLICIRPEDVAGRFGGDEFVIVVRQAPPRADVMLLERIADALAEPVKWEGGAWIPSASLGVARGAVGDDVVALVRRADQAMFVDKRQRKSGH